MRLFRNRLEAASELAQHLAFLKDQNPVVVGLANGGVPIAEVIARHLDAPLDILHIEKLAAPDAPNLIVGAIDAHGRISIIRSTARWHHVTTEQLAVPARDALRQLQHRQTRIRACLPETDVRGRTVVVVGQAVVSGAKLLGAIASLKDRGAAKVVAAAPAGTESATWQLHEAASMVVMPHRPAKFKGVESLYEDYSDVTDEIVLMIAQRWSAARPMDATQTPAPSPSESPSGKAPLTAHFKNSRGQSLACELDLPPGMMRGSGPYPAVVFAHGSESSAQSPRNLAIGAGLAQRGVIGVRMDFTGHGRSEGSSADASEFHLLTDLHVIFTHVAGLAEVDRDRLGLVGSGTGGLIALHYAAQQPMVKALVIRGPVCGRETVVARQVKSPTLLIHAEQDTAFLDAVQTLDRELASPHKLLRIPNATRLFDDPISREAMVNATVDWLVDHLKLPTTGHGVESRLEIETTSRMDMPLSAT